MSFSTMRYEPRRPMNNNNSHQTLKKVESMARTTYAKKKMMTTGSLQCNESSTSNDDNRKPGYHRFMSESELRQFRTRLCPNIARHGKCPDGDACMDSHCKAFQRRDPSLVEYFVQLCPRISFISAVDANGRKKMSLVNKCPYGKQCRFSHTQEERLYHPAAYKTQPCRGYPKCKPFCPFAHGKGELQQGGVTVDKINTMDRTMESLHSSLKKNNDKLLPFSPPLSVTSTMAPSPLLLPQVCGKDFTNDNDSRQLLYVGNGGSITPMAQSYDSQEKEGYLPSGFALNDFCSSDEEDESCGEEDLLLFVLD